jgi:hypothetical protein
VSPCLAGKQLLNKISDPLSHAPDALQHATSSGALQSQVFESLPKDRWYTTIVDKNALRVLSSHMKLSDLLEHNVSVVDPLEISRKPAKDAVYLISPLAASMRRVLDDFSGPKPLYESVRLYFTSKASEEALEMLKSCAPLVKRLQALKEVLSPRLQPPSRIAHAQ